MRDHAVPAADIVTPNQFELDYLSGRTTATTRDALAAIDALHALGPKAILVTSLHTDETPADAIDLVASDASGRFRVRTPKLPISVNGAGDAIAALFFAHYLRSGSAAEAALARSVFGIRRAQAHRRCRRARNPAGRCAGRVRQSEPRVRGRADLRRHHAPPFRHARCVHRQALCRQSARGRARAGRARHRRDADDRARVQSVGNSVRVSAGRQGEPREAAHLHAGARASVRRASDGRDGGAARAHRRRERRARFVLEENDRPGAVPRDVERRRQRARARSTFRGCPQKAGDAPDAATMAAALGLSRGRYRLRRLSGRRAGRPASRSRSCRCAASTRSARMPHRSCDNSRRAFGGGAHAAAFMFCRETAERGHAFHARMFAPRQGVHEDPATGSAAAAFAGYLAAHGGYARRRARRSASSRATRWAARA